MTGYSATEVMDKLIPYSDVMDTLSPLDNLTRRAVLSDGSEKIDLTIPDEYAEGWGDLDATAPLPGVMMGVGNTEYRLTKAAFESILQQVGLRHTYASKTPGSIMELNLTHHLTHSGTKSDLNTYLINDDTIFEVVPGSASVFSTYSVADTIGTAVAQHYGVHTDQLFYDYKHENSLSRSSFRLIVPDTHHLVKSERQGKQVEDMWSTGINFTNSMTGLASAPLSVTGYLFAWWCTNGSTTDKAHSEVYSKRATGASWEAVQEWLRASTMHTLELLPTEMEKVEELTQINLRGELTTTMRELATSFGIPAGTLAPIQDSLVESSDTTAYGFMQAVTQAANDPDMPDTRVSKIMEAGGGFAHAFVDRCDTCHRLNV